MPHEQAQGMTPDGFVSGDILFTNGVRPLISCRRPLRPWSVPQAAAHVVQRPAEVDCSRPGSQQLLTGGIKRFVRWISVHRKANAVSRCCTDQRGTADAHDGDGFSSLVDGPQWSSNEAKG